MHLALIILGLLVVGIPAVGNDLLPDDATFSKTITLDMKGEALSDVAKVLSKTAGVSIRASNDIADQKVTILVDNMPIQDVMNRLATLFGWSWTVRTDDDGNSTYIIYDPLKQKREADRKEALDRAWEALGAKLDSLSYDAGSAKSFYQTLALLQYGSLSPELREAYLSGMRICYSWESPTFAWRPSQAVMDEFANAGSRIQQKLVLPGREGFPAWEADPTHPNCVTIELYSAVGTNLIVARSKILVAYYHPSSDEHTRVSIGVSGASRSDESEATGVPASESGFDLCTQKIDYPLETLENILPNKPADELLARKVSISVAELLAEGAVVDEKTGACHATRTDLLAALHNKLGLQIISDYYSSWGPFKDVQDITVKQLVEEKLPGFPANWGWDGNVFYIRVKDIRTADSREIPNRLLRPWQAVVKKQGYRGLEELAQAAAFLSGEQRWAISKNSRYLKLGECKEIDDLGGRESALLRFCGLLTPKQKRDIFAGGVGVMGLTLKQRNALATLLYSTNFTHVGIYNSDGLNVNEPQVVRGSSGTPAVGVQMTCSGSFIYLKPGDDLDSRVLRMFTATTPEEALLAAQNQIGKDADPQNVIAQDDIIYTLTVRYDGYLDTINEPVPGFFGSTGRSAHSTCHRVKIKIPEKNGTASVGK